jgi:hypothetical protein
VCFANLSNISTHDCGYQTNTPQESFESLGLSGGGKAIAKSKQKFAAMVELLVRIASLQVEGDVEFRIGLEHE